MKSMTCKELAGACDKIFSGNTFEELAAQSKQHGKEMFEQKDAAHLEAMQKMQDLMTEPGAFEKWFAERKAAFESLPED